jgi:kexin
VICSISLFSLQSHSARTTRTGPQPRPADNTATNVKLFPLCGSIADSVDGYGKIDAGRFVELARTWPLVKPQAWFDSPAVYLPTDEIPRLSRPTTENPDTIKRQNGGDDEQSNDPIVTGTGTYITSDGIKSTYEVTQEMLDEANVERLEHVTARVWIDHQRRGDVEVELLSPSGQLSVLARQRRFDEATTGFAGWKFMSVKHWYVIDSSRGKCR